MDKFLWIDKYCGVHWGCEYLGWYSNGLLAVLDWVTLWNGADRSNAELSEMFSPGGFG